MNFFKKTAIVATLIFTAFLFIPSGPVLATTTELVDTINGPATIMQKTAGLSTFTLGQVITVVIKGALSLLGIIFLIIIVFAGYRWMTASGNEESITKSKDMIKRAIIGLVIVLLAYAITYFVFNQLPFGGNNT